MMPYLKKISYLILIEVLFVSHFAIAQSKNISAYQGVQKWIDTKNQRMDWYRKARFGMFIHWGLYSAAGGSWNGKKYPQHYAEWIETWAKVPSKEYAKELKPKFTAAKFNADDWAALAKEAGMKYVVITSRHHEGFSIFNSKQAYSLNNDITGGTNISPKGRDLYGELITAFKKKGLKAGAYYSLLDWQNPDSYDGFDLNPNTTNYKPDHDKYRQYLYGQIKELATNYDAFDILWPDFSTKGTQGETWGTQRILTDLIKWKPNIIINNRFWDGLENKYGDFGTPEKYVPPTGLPGMDWEVSHTMNESYGYSAHDSNWKSYDKIMHLFLETVSKGGNFLLNVGPDGEGVIPTKAVALLKDIGQWMKVNSESIYGTTASPFQSLDWGYCTQKPGKLFLHVFDVPENRKLLVPLKSEIKKAYILGNDSKKLIVNNGKDGKIITLPATINGKQPIVVIAEISGKPNVVESKVEINKDGRLVLTANSAKLSRGLKLTGATTHDPNRPNAIDNWKDKNDVAYWEVKIQKPGTYKFIINYKPADKKSGSVQIRLDDIKVQYSFKKEPAGGFKDVDAGTIEISQKAIGASSLKIYLEAMEINGTLPEISSITLIPSK